MVAYTHIHACLLETTCNDRNTMVSTVQLRLNIRNLLPTLDLETSTQKSIQEQVEEDMGVTLDDSQKAVVREEIEMFLHEKCMQQDSDRKRKPGEMSSAAADREEGTQKRAKEDAVIESSEVPGFYAIASKRFVGVTSYAGKVLVNIREYYEKDGKVLPGSKGISLTIAQWEQLKKIADTGMVLEALKEPGSDGKVFDISPTRKISVRLFGSKVLVDIREYYEKEGQSLPGKKGISLVPEQWEKLVQIIPHIQAQLDGRGLSTNDEEPRAQTVSPPAGGGHETGQQQQQDSSEQTTRYQISSNRFVSLENWKGSDTIDIREYYEANGEQRPGKKGITLSSSQVQALVSEIEAVSNALSAQDGSYSLQLSSKRQVTVSVFKGVPMVNIREYYEKDGGLLPTKKGISLPEDQWASCKAALESLTKIMNP